MDTNTIEERVGENVMELKKDKIMMMRHQSGPWCHNKDAQ